MDFLCIYIYKLIIFNILKINLIYYYYFLIQYLTYLIYDFEFFGRDIWKFLIYWYMIFLNDCLEKSIKKLF